MASSVLPKLTDNKNLKGTYVLLRASLNVPIVDGEVSNQFRLMRGMPTIQYLIKNGARVIIAGHIGRDHEDTLEPVYRVLKEHLPITFCDEIVGPKAKELRDALKDGEILLLENVRKDPREKKNDMDFARSLADLADMYVDDAFAAAHREHASLVGVPSFLPSYIGMNFQHEYEELSKAMQPKSPSLFILGGAKFDTKMPLVEKYLDIYDQVFVGGALANDFFNAKGYEIGDSLVSDIDLSRSPLMTYEKVLLPVDVIVDGKNGVRTCLPNEVEKGEIIYDAGPETIHMLTPYIQKAEMILWNGPFGSYEKGFKDQTEECARKIADAKGYSIIGGGDTIAAIEFLCQQEKYDFLSTAGGAMLTFLEHGTLPAIEAIKNNPGS